jgi:hypothetical protein
VIQIADTITVEGNAVVLQTDKATHIRDQHNRDHQPADRRVSELPDVDEPGARRYAGGWKLHNGHSASAHHQITPEANETPTSRASTAPVSMCGCLIMWAT